MEEIAKLAASQLDEMIKGQLYKGVRELVCQPCPHIEECQTPCMKAVVFMRMNWHRVAQSIMRWN